MIIGLVNSKGGVGKSTLAVHVAAWWKEQGGDVALVDADVQHASSLWLHEACPHVPIVRLATPDEILDQVPDLRRKYDLVAVDGPAGLSEVTRAILLVADIAILPCGPSVLDLRAASEAIRVVRQAQAIRHGPPHAVLVPNKLQVQYRLSREMLEAAKSLGIPPMSPLCLRQAYADAAGQGLVVWRLGRRGEAASREIRELFHELFDSTVNERSVANG